MRILESQRCTEKCCGLFTPLAAVTGSFPTGEIRINFSSICCHSVVEHRDEIY